MPDITYTFLIFIKIALLLTLPPVAAIAVIGFIVSFFQAITQIQEQSIGFALKLIGAVVATWLSVKYFGPEFHNMSAETIASIWRL